ncbi:MAG: RNA-binding S4 domain-containing protein [Acidobacteria bacterium]|nr:RNA-binding S4 domain-containing protein [Acidobacteriota bacterium]
MRLDIYLKLSRLITRRTLAKEFADAGLIKVNGSTAKSSKEISPGDKIEITRYPRILTVEVLALPQAKQISKKDAGFLYRVTSETAMPDPLDLP